MKTTKIWMALVAVAFLASCGVSKPKGVTLNNQIDSLNYAFGVANGEEIAQYYLANDSTGESLKELLAGFQEGLKAKSDANPQLVELGTQIGTTLKEQTKTGLMGDDSLKVNIELIRQGLINGLRGAELGMTSAQAQEYLQTTMMSLQERRSAVENAPNREAGEAFLAENATREGVVVTESGLQYQVIKAGKGKKPTAEDRVKVHYHGTLIDGTVFDSSVDRGEPTSFGVTQVIAGWTEALQLMPVGSKWKLFIPYNLAYGERDAGTIKPYSALVFEVELLAIEK